MLRANAKCVRGLHTSNRRTKTRNIQEFAAGVTTRPPFLFPHLQNGLDFGRSDHKELVERQVCQSSPAKQLTLFPLGKPRTRVRSQKENMSPACAPTAKPLPTPTSSIKARRRTASKTLAHRRTARLSQRRDHGTGRCHAQQIHAPAVPPRRDACVAKRQPRRTRPTTGEETHAASTSSNQPR
jgi:hypothetical protein